MAKLTVADAAIKLGVSKEAIHNRIRRGSLQTVVENDIKLVIIDSTAKAAPKRTSTQNKKTSTVVDDRYYKLLEEQNASLQNRVNTLEGETRTLRDQKEQMLVDERIKIEQIYKDKDEQLKNILNALSSKFMLSAPNEDLLEAEIEEEQPQPRLISLNKHLKSMDMSKKKREKIKENFKRIASTDGRVITIGKKHYIDLAKYDYSDLSL